MRPTFALAVLAMCCAGAASSAAAPIITNDSSIADPPGVYYGAGNSNGHFTVGTNDANPSLEAALRASIRFMGAVTPSGNLYTVPAGTTQAAGQTGSTWGVDFSVNLNADGKGALDIGDITAQFTFENLTIGGPPSTGSIESLADNVYTDGADVCRGFPACDAGRYSGVQNSQPGSIIAAAFGDMTYNLNDPGLYRFTLTVFETRRGIPLVGSQILVSVVTPSSIPEPLSLGLFGAGLACAAAMRRRAHRFTKAIIL